MSDRLRFHNPDIPDPILLHTVDTRNGIGYFPGLSIRFKHGFWWENPPNIAYIQEPGFGEGTLDRHKRAKAIVDGRVRTFLRKSGMGLIEDSTIIGAYPGAMGIIDLTEGLLAQPKTTEHPGHYVPGGALFTTLPNKPVYTIGGDCTWSFIYCNRPGQLPVGGMAHSGRREVENLFPKTVITHLVNNYDCDPRKIEVAIIPSLEPEHHVIQTKDFPKDIKYPWRWTDYMQITEDQEQAHLDVRSWVADQFIESGVSPDNIILSVVGSYESRAQGFGVSYRYSTVHGIPAGRMAVGFQLSNPLNRV